MKFSLEQIISVLREKEYQFFDKNKMYNTVLATT